MRGGVACFHLKRDFSEKEGQIAHLDHDKTNGAEDNLVFLCLPHHSLYDSRTSQHKNYTILEVKAARKMLAEHVESFESDMDAMEEEADEPIEKCEETAVLGPNEHKVYPFKMTEAQRIIGSVSSDDPIDVFICKERDYEEWDREESEDDLPKSYFYAEDIRHRSIDGFLSPFPIIRTLCKRTGPAPGGSEPSGKIRVATTTTRISLPVLRTDILSTAGLGRAHPESTPEAISEVAEDT